jgi:hypothetical protein
MRKYFQIALTFLAGTGVALAQVSIIPGDRFRSWTAEDAAMEQFETYHVVTEADDEAGIDSLILDALLGLGLEATIGSAEEMPAETQVKVTYESWYQEKSRVQGVTDLVIYIRDPSTDVLIAVAEMEKVHELPGPETIASAVSYLVGRPIEIAELPLPTAELTKAYKVRSTDPEGSIPDFSAKGEVSVINAQPPLRWPLIYPMRMIAKKEYVDHQQLLDVAIEALDEHLEEAGATVLDEGGEKTITLEVNDLANIEIMQTYINFTVRTGDGYVKGLQAYGEHWNYRKSVDAAVADIAVQVLSDPHIIAYLEQ